MWYVCHTWCVGCRACVGGCEVYVTRGVLRFVPGWAGRAGHGVL